MSVFGFVRQFRLNSIDPCFRLLQMEDTFCCQGSIAIFTHESADCRVCVIKITHLCRLIAQKVLIKEIKEKWCKHKKRQLGVAAFSFRLSTFRVIKILPALHFTFSFSEIISQVQIISKAYSFWVHCGATSICDGNFFLESIQSTPIRELIAL